MLKRELVIPFLVVCFIFASVPDAFCRSSPPTIFVAGDGSGDYNCDGKSDQVQINQALQFVSNNPEYTTVHLKGPFTYVIDDTLLIGSDTTLKGDSTAIIKLSDHAGWPTMKPLIQQMSNSGNSNITIRDFEVDGNYAGNSEITLGRGFYNVMYFTYSSNIKVYNMYMHDGTGDGLRTNKVKNIQFYNNTIYKLGHDGLFAIRSEDVEAWNNRITCRTNSALRAWNSNNVKFHDNLIDSFYHWSAGGPGIQIEKSENYTMDSIEIYNNVIHNTYGPGIWIVTHDTTSATDGQAKNIHIHHNIFYNTGTNPSITWVGGIIASGFHDTLIENNVFDGCYGAAIAHMFSADYSPKGGFATIIRNNIIVNTQKRTNDPAGTGCGIANYLPDTHYFVMDNDCLFNNSGGDYKNCISTTDIYVDPFVADLINHDYHLQSKAGRWNGKTWVTDKVSSTCIDAGYRYSDYSNEPEPNGDRINIGPDGNTIYASKSELVPLRIFPTANFSSNVTSGNVPLTIKFTDLSKNATAWKWDFGDGTNSTDRNPVHTYSATQYYTVSLTVSNANGTASMTNKINVRSISSTGPYAYIPNSGNGTVSVIDTVTNTVTAVVNVGRNPWGVAVSSDGKKAYVTNVFSDSLSVIDTDTNTVAATVNGFDEPWGVAVTPDGKKVYVTHSNSNKISVIDTATNTVAATVAVGNNPRGVAVSPDGTRAYVTNQNNNTVSVLDKATNNILATVSVGRQPWGVSVSPDGTKVYVANYGGSTISVINAAANYVSATVPVGANPIGIAVKPDGTKAYVTNYGSNTVSIIDTATNTVTTTVGVGNIPYGVAFTPDGTRAYVANLDSSSVSVIDTAANSVTAVVNVGRSAAFGQFIAPPLAQPAKILPVANFSTNISGGYGPLSVKFTDLSKNATEWNWNFGDGFNSTQQNPMHTYLVAGNYNATLTAENSNGTDSMTRKISVAKEEMISDLSGIYNNRLREASPENIYSSSSYLDVGGMNGVGRYRDVIWFDLSKYTSDTQISNATLSLFWYYPNDSRLKDTIVEIYRPASVWNSSFVSWNKRNVGIAWNNSGGDWYDNNGVFQGSIPYATITLRASNLPNNSYCEFNVTDIVREYVSGKYSNTGFLIKARAESDNYIAFYSAQRGNASEVPKLKLVYS